MNNLTNNVLTGINAGIYYFTAAVSAIVSNPALLIISAFMLLMTGKSVQLGKNLKAKG